MGELPIARRAFRIRARAAIHCAAICRTAIFRAPIFRAPIFRAPIFSGPINWAPALLAIFCLVQAGDTDASSNSEQEVHSRPVDDGNFLLADIAGSLIPADIIIANLEGVMMESGNKPQKQCDDSSSCFAFRSPPQYARLLRNAGISAVSLANNHSHDFGTEGFIETKTHLAAHGIQSSGGKGDFAMWPDREVRTAMVAFSTYGYANNMNDIQNARTIVSRLDEFYDVVIVSFHGGAEGINQSRLPFKTEYYEGENRGDVVSFSRAMVDAGADLVVGHGPHVPRAIELYNQRLIAYSLGNFATYEGIRIDDKRGYAPVILTTMNASGEFLCGKIVSAQQSREHGVQIDTGQLAYKEIKDLTNEDLAGGGFHFDQDGYFNVAGNTNSTCY